jgi:hypothetical protein
VLISTGYGELGQFEAPSKEEKDKGTEVGFTFSKQ